MERENYYIGELISLGPDRLNRMTKLKYYDKLLIERLRGTYENDSDRDTGATL